MKLHEQYMTEAKALQIEKPFEGSLHVGWKSPSNIALVKYWGKHGPQLPQNPSLSFTLSKSFSETSVEFAYRKNDKSTLSFIFEGKKQPVFQSRMNKYIDTLDPYFPFLKDLDLRVESVNSFPHSSGIASSASGMSALALCLVSIEQRLFGSTIDKDSFFNKASFMARLGSGSAARSVFGDFVVWGFDDQIAGSSDEVGLQMNFPGKDMRELGDAILITSSDKKSVSSSAGHGLMDTHPYAEARYAQARQNTTELLAALKTLDEQSFIRIVENEALSLHALMMNSEPGFTLLNNNTWSIIHAVRKYRSETSLFMAFTLDAGPNVHLIYKKEDKDEIVKFIDEKLINYCENGYWIDDEIGSGPVELN